MSERTKQALIAFLTGLALVEIPIVIGFLTAVPQPNASILLAGLLGGLLTALKRWSETAAVSVAALHTETYAKLASSPPEPSPLQQNMRDQL